MKNKGAKIIVNSITMTRVIGTLLMPFISLLLSPGELIFYIIILLLTDRHALKESRFEYS